MSFFLSAQVPQLNVSYKPQKISPKSQGTVQQLLHEKIRESCIHQQFISDVIRPLQVEQLYDQEVKPPTIVILFNIPLCRPLASHLSFGRVKIGLDGQKLWTGINYFYITERVEWYSVCQTRIRALITFCLPKMNPHFIPSWKHNKMIKICKRAVFN